MGWVFPRKWSGVPPSKCGERYTRGLAENADHPVPDGLDDFLPKQAQHESSQLGVSRPSVLRRLDPRTASNPPRSAWGEAAYSGGADHRFRQADRRFQAMPITEEDHLASARSGAADGLALEALTDVLKHLDSERMAQCDQILGEYTAECQQRLTVQ